MYTVHACRRGRSRVNAVSTDLFVHRLTRSYRQQYRSRKTNDEPLLLRPSWTPPEDDEYRVWRFFAKLWKNSKIDSFLENTFFLNRLLHLCLYLMQTGPSIFFSTHIYVVCSLIILSNNLLCPLLFWTNPLLLSRFLSSLISPISCLTVSSLFFP